mmetsp:Transcript_13251/g.25403  ORF Transcript_13251/g.25403 Transcript_13251/m.25403 type:complete len:200 (-) Transcript_13251:99-698(-)
MTRRSTVMVGHCVNASVRHLCIDRQLGCINCPVDWSYGPCRLVRPIGIWRRRPSCFIAITTSWWMTISLVLPNQMHPTMPTTTTTCKCTKLDTMAVVVDKTWYGRPHGGAWMCGFVRKPNTRQGLPKPKKPCWPPPCPVCNPPTSWKAPMGRWIPKIYKPTVGWNFGNPSNIIPSPFGQAPKKAKDPKLPKYPICRTNE